MADLSATYPEMREYHHNVAGMNKCLDGKCAYNRAHPLFVFVFGMGCQQYSRQQQAQSLAFYRNIIQTYAISSNNLVFLCRSTKKILVDLGRLATTGCRAGVLNRSAFVEQFASFVQDHSNVHPAVYLYGHSFGGAICNRIAEIVGNDNVFVRTFGAVYITNRARVPIANYMDPNDVAWDKLARHCADARANVRLTGDETATQASRNPFGNASQWTTHNTSYVRLQRERISVDCLMFRIRAIVGQDAPAASKRESLLDMMRLYDIRGFPEVSSYLKLTMDGLAKSKSPSPKTQRSQSKPPPKTQSKSPPKTQSKPPPKTQSKSPAPKTQSKSPPKTQSKSPAPKTQKSKSKSPKTQKTRLRVLNRKKGCRRYLNNTPSNRKRLGEGNYEIVNASP